MKFLQVDSSARASSVTRRLTAKFTEEWKKNHPDGEVIQRDLPATALPLITDDWSATYLDDSKLTPAQRAYLSTSDELIEELQVADTVVLGAPMYNSSIPSLLKAWIDQIVRLGKTVGYGPNGPQGLLARKKIVRKLSLSLLAGLPMKRALRGELSIFRNPTCSTFWLSSDLQT
ncbi:MAG: FMN-dependent NADH-azoreductase [Acidobacteriaceae bacterium]|jgi:FMN-dependent NADH-azoreductase|nr:FMN-dependent NADH-azoreductase [Acidobacteriaceae bacterium]MDT7810422.1 FMN-dependent NADH-azoreductase [Acidobacteriaceae bacterium]MDX6457010.1 FMN-dependent NADH-azoreductase [Acidobacteriaceae bacterium]